MNVLKRLDLRGFRSIRDLAGLELGSLNVLIGANGSGRTNLISFFKLLGWMTRSNEGLQFYVGLLGGANALLFDGAAVTPQVEAALAFETLAGTNEYYLRLFHAAQDALIFAEEKYRFSARRYPTRANWTQLGAGHRETRLTEKANQGNQTAQFLLRLLQQCVVYQFHNTSDTARVRQRWSVEENRHLKEDAANLAPFLLRLRDTERASYARIVDTVRQTMPFFDDFVLDPVGGAVILQWREKGSGLVFGAHQASDGSLRVMALVSLLLQPEGDLSQVLILDEPELGLHPYAIGIVAGLLRSVSTHAQVILATQSTTLVDYFEPEHIVVVDRPDRETVFRRLDPENLREWLAEYSLSELWEKNVLGGRPSR